VSFGIADEAEWFTSNLAPGTSECGWLFNKTAYEALPEQYQTLLMDLKQMGMDVAQAAYAAQDEINLPVFKETMQEIIYTDEQIAEFRAVAGQPVWDAWIAENADKFDAQGVFDAVWAFAEEAQNQ
jgi:TRAP-type C4-dicarboxylate transport system substrate-binding protein